MPRISFLLCSGVCVLNATVIIGQSLTKNPAQQQVIGYRIQQQKMWDAQQLPKNSVLFKSDHRYAAWQSRKFSFKKEKEPAIAFPSAKLFSIQNPAIMNTTSSQSLPLLLQSHLFQEKQLYNQWRKQSWWKDPTRAQGSLWLRDFLINSKSRNNYHL